MSHITILKDITIVNTRSDIIYDTSIFHILSMNPIINKKYFLSLVLFFKILKEVICEKNH